MKKFEAFGTLLTRSEAKEIRGGGGDPHNPHDIITNPTDPGSGGGSTCNSALCDAQAKCKMPIDGRDGWCAWRNGRCGCGIV